MLINNIKYFMKILQKCKMLGPTGIRTQIAGFKVQSTNHYTIRPLFINNINKKSKIFYFPKISGFSLIENFSKINNEKIILLNNKIKNKDQEEYYDNLKKQINPYFLQL